MYLKIYNHNGYDEFYSKLDNKDETWKDVLNNVEDILEEQFYQNNESLNGIEVHFKIVNKMPEDVETK